MILAEWSLPVISHLLSSEKTGIFWSYVTTTQPQSFLSILRSLIVSMVHQFHHIHKSTTSASPPCPPHPLRLQVYCVHHIHHVQHVDCTHYANLAGIAAYGIPPTNDWADFRARAEVAGSGMPVPALLPPILWHFVMVSLGLSVRCSHLSIGTGWGGIDQPFACAISHAKTVGIIA